MTARPVIRRLATEDDALYDEMLDVFGRAFEDPETYGAARPGSHWRRSLLSSEHFVALVALDGPHVVGALAGYELMKFERERTEFYIFDLAVAEPFRRRGIAIDLVRAFCQIARERRGWIVYVQADLEDLPAIALYENLGARKKVIHFEIIVADL